MDLQEQRLTCLRMALEMGCKADSIVSVATELLAFLSDEAPAAAKSPAEERSEEVIAACGTALAASEAAALVAHAEPAEAVDTPAAAAISREALLEPPSTPSEVPAAQETSAVAAADVEVAVEPVPAKTAGGTSVGVQSEEPAPASEQSRTEQALAAEASKIADEAHSSAQATEVAAVSNGVGQKETTGAVVTAG